MELGVSGWTDGRTVRDNATHLEVSAAHESHSTEVSGFIFRACNTSAWWIDRIAGRWKDIQEIQGLRRCRRAEGPAEEKGESQKVVDSNVARGHGGLLRFP